MVLPLSQAPRPLPGGFYSVTISLSRTLDLLSLPKCKKEVLGRHIILGVHAGRFGSVPVNVSGELS